MITEKTTDYKKKGLPQEALANGVHLALAKKHGLESLWTGKKSYEDSKSNEERRGVDSELISKVFAVVAWLVVECKNFSQPIKRYGEDTAHREVNLSAELLDVLHRLLVIPSFDVFTKKARKEILRNKWQVFETGKVISFEDFENGTAL